MLYQNRTDMLRFELSNPCELLIREGFISCFTFRQQMEL